MSALKTIKKDAYRQMRAMRRRLETRQIAFVTLVQDASGRTLAAAYPRDAASRWRDENAPEAELIDFRLEV